ncbi:ATP-binding protein [Pelotalea chapellei]|uniref:ATP-binding protein n=1 Tax=Pelotalea chapellei TaxID=44671 RepID=A0ABS5U7W0_9BACT|nr:ATP-binding protein [Pelotalea chapellei]MBT1071763.1 ATP-binding protein [Pelotalea chapellei]
MPVSDAALEVLLQKINLLVDRLTPPLAEIPDFEHYHAFRWERAGETGRLVPVAHPHLVDLNELVGINDIREEVVRNTAQFVNGLPANNVLLWGERGCGKSSLVKGLLKPFGPKGLRIVELKRWDIMSLPQIVAQLRNSSCYFLLFCDDLSFDEGEGDFRALKTLLDGDIEERPANVLIYATSNRRHLMPERAHDSLNDEEIHPEEAVGEKLALSDRFGLCFGFYRFDQNEYLAIVRHYAKLRKIYISDEILCDKALKWCMYTARRSGRSARQFIDDLEGRLRLEKG